jgi:hypothetical protein
LCCGHLKVSFVSGRLVESSNTLAETLEHATVAH